MSLIVPVEVIAKAHVDHNMDPQVYCSHIPIAEAKLADSCFGYELFNAMVADLVAFTDYLSTATYNINDVVIFQGKYYKCLSNGTINVVPAIGPAWAASNKFTTLKYQTLWDKHLWQILAIMVQHTGTFTNSIRTTAAGEMKNSANNSSGADFQEVRAKKEELSDNIRVLTGAMDRYLRANKTDFDLYPGNKDCATKCSTKPSLGVFLNKRRREHG